MLKRIEVVLKSSFIQTQYIPLQSRRAVGNANVTHFPSKTLVPYFWYFFTALPLKGTANCKSANCEIVFSGSAQSLTIIKVR